MIAEEVMTTTPVSVDPTASAREALERMFDAGVRHLPVVNDDDLVGILSDRDLRGLWLPPGSSGGDESAQPLDQNVGELMNSDVVVVTPDTDLGEVVDLMLDNKIGALPVVRPGTQELVGVVSYVDVLRAARESL